MEAATALLVGGGLLAVGFWSGLFTRFLAGGEVLVGGRRVAVRGVRVVLPGAVGGYRVPAAQRRPAPPTAIVLHDTVTCSTSGTIAVLERRGVGTHFLVDPDGTVFQTADPATDVVWHAEGWNLTGVGVDVVTPIDPDVRCAGGAWPMHGPTPWAPRGYWDYTDAQKRAVRALVPALARALGVPYTWSRELTGVGRTVPGLSPATYSGIVAHAQVKANRWDGLVGLVVLTGAV